MYTVSGCGYFKQLLEQFVMGFICMEIEQTKDSSLVKSTGEHIKSKELPLVVFLRGDEDCFEDFSWSADKVMDVLNIKRSRLNQLSGRELRVGKKKMDRYIRPVYRPCDVYNYLEWTRPTASHQRSSKIMDEARKKLEDHSKKLKVTLEDYDKKIHNVILHSMSVELLKIYKFIKHETCFLNNNIVSNFNQQKLSNFKFVQKLLEVIEQVADKVNHKDKNIHKLSERIDDLDNSLSKCYSLSENSYDKLSTDISNLSTALDLLDSHIEELSKKSDRVSQSTLPSMVSKYRRIEVKKFKPFSQIARRSHPCWAARKLNSTNKPR
jgi:DNA repair exonuclease SbcCD ATPase subunit